VVAERGTNISGTTALSVCILTSRRHRELEACLASVTGQVDPPTFEILVCANDDPDTEEVVRRVAPGARVVHSPKSRLGSARNLLLAEASGDLLLFLDDVLDPHLLARLHHSAEAHPDVTVFGGPNLTPSGSSRFQIVQGAVLGSLVGAGPVRRRYGRHPAGPADERFFTLCNLAIRRAAMIAFPADVTGGEENALLLELSRREGAMLYDPDLHVFHVRRARLRPFARQMFKYGAGRGQVIARHRRGLRPAFLAPTMLIGYLALLPILLTVSPLAALPLLVYCVAAAATGLRVAWPMRDPAAVPLTALLVAVVHLAYGAGVVAGLLARRPAPAAARALADLGDGGG
jgi:GT2 family glycosyltransferase